MKFRKSGLKESYIRMIYEAEYYSAMDIQDIQSAG
jgi:hypothetical protein